MGRRAFLAAIGAGGVAATAGRLGSAPGLGSDGCGPGEVRIEALRDGEYAGEQVTVAGKLDHSPNAAEGGTTAFRPDGESGAVAVFFGDPADRHLDFGDCLAVRGTVRPSDGRSSTDGAVVADATFVGDAG